MEKKMNKMLKRLLLKTFFLMQNIEESEGEEKSACVREKGKCVRGKGCG